MSRIGKKPIIIPEGVTYEYKDGLVSVSGVKGNLTFHPRPEVSLKTDENKVLVEVENLPEVQAIHGTTRQVIADMVTGVNQGWSKTLEVIGTGFRALTEGPKLVLSVGFSHKVEVIPPAGITFLAQENKITVNGPDKALVGKVAAEIRQIRPPDAYKGKGIRYLGERIRLKPGKAAKVGAGAAAK